MTRTCQYCGQEFTAPPARVLNGRGHYCSRPCYYAHLRAHGNAQTIVPTRQCLTCGRQFRPTAGAWRKGHGHCCSRTCADVQRSRTMAAIRSGRVPADVDGYGPRWAKHARLIRKRDNYTCQHCGKRQTRPALHVHHVRHRSEFHGDMDAANAPDNLIALCAKCHRAAERQAGRH